MLLIGPWLKKHFLFFEKLKRYAQEKKSRFLMLILTCTFVIVSTPLNAVALTQLGSDIDGVTFTERSGWSVSMSADGSRVAIGAPYYKNGLQSEAGNVRIYEYTAGSWRQLGGDIYGEAGSDHSGWSVSMSADGSRVAIGAPQNRGTATKSGHVRIYAYDGSNWTQLGDDIDGEAYQDHSGWSVSLSADGNTVAIGAPYNDGANGTSTNSGHIRVYNYDGSNWTQLGGDIDGEAAYDQSGSSISLSTDGSRVAIGASQNGDRSGHIRIYEYSDGNWTQLGGDIDGEAASDCVTGISVSLSADGNTVAIGAPLNDGANGTSTNSGHVRVYNYDGSNWTQLGGDIDGEAADDESGSSVSLSADGSRVAIGAPLNSSTDAILDTEKGQVRIYEYSDENWKKLDSDIDGEDYYDNSGTSVSLSADGSRVAIGAPLNDTIANPNAGHARVYELYLACGNTSTPLTENTWWSVSRPCGISTDPTIKELFSNPDGSGLGIYGDGNDWVMWKLNGTNPDGTENYNMITDSSEVMKSGVGYWIITSKTGVKWNPGATAETLDPTGAYWNVATTGTVGQTSLNGINAPDVKEFLIVDPITDGGLTLIQDTQLALIGNPFPKKITWSNVYFSNNGTDYTAIDSIPSGVQPIAYVSDPDSTSGQPYKAISSVAGFTHTIEPNQAFWIQMTGTVERHAAKRIALPLEY